MDEWIYRKTDSRQSDLVCCRCELTNLCSHHSDVVPCRFLPVQNLGGPDDAAVHPNGEIQRSVLFIFYKVPVIQNDDGLKHRFSSCNIIQDTLSHDDATERQ